MIKENLEKILAAKQNIKTALENKQVDMAGVTFSDYAIKINELETFVTANRPSFICAYRARPAIAYMSSAVKIGSYMFAEEDALWSASFPAARGIEKMAFYGCSNLSQVNFPVATFIGSSAFYGCETLESAIFPAATTISSAAFRACYALSAASFPEATTVLDYAFYSCSNLRKIYFPKATTISYQCFYSCRGLTSVYLPQATSIGNGAFRECVWINTVNLPNVRYISGYAFYNCTTLKSLYMLGPTICSLAASNALSSSPVGGYSGIAGRYGSIFVRASLLESYKTSTNWVYYSSRFVGLTDEEIENLEV